MYEVRFFFRVFDLVGRGFFKLYDKVFNVIISLKGD